MAHQVSADRLIELLTKPEERSERIALDRVLAVIGQIDRDGPSEDTVAASLDQLSAQLVGSTPSDVVTGVFGGLGFTGNSANYYDARNSIIHHVLQRRLGIPLTLAVVTIELGHRHGVDLDAVGMPGHVLLGSEEGWHDPFRGGAALDIRGCQEIFHTIHPDAPFLDHYLQPMSGAQIAARMLENLRIACMGGGDLAQLASVLELRAALPGAPVDHRMEYARALAALGRYDLAADQRELLAELLPQRADHHVSEAARLRAHRN